MQRFRADDLVDFSERVLKAAGLEDGPARVTARTLVDADCLGYVTHGIQFLPQYTSELESGRMARSGDLELVSERGTALVFDGHMLPGPYCVRTAIDVLLRHEQREPIAAAVIRRSANTACLATYLLPIVRAGRIGIVMASSPAGRAVAPAGGREARYSTNPLAFGFPTGGDPILIDMATSATTNRLTEKLQREGREHRGFPMLDGDGNPTNDPFALTKERGGAIRPFGGDTNEHKGFALALAVQAMSAALSGGGIPEQDRPAGSSTFVQVIDPEAFAGGEVWRAELDHFTHLLRETPPRAGSQGVRIPGARAMAALRRQKADGVEISDELLVHVAPLAEEYAVPFPTALPRASVP